MKPIEFTIHGIIRGGKNGILINRFGRRYPNKSWAIWRDRVVSDLRIYLQEAGIRESLTTACWLRVRYYAGDARRRDVPAMLDSLFHCFERAGLVEDDSLIRDVTWEWGGIDRENPGVRVRIGDE